MSKAKPKKLQLREGAHYRSRSGRKVGPMERVVGGVGGFDQEDGQRWRGTWPDGTARYFHDNGVFTHDLLDADCDLVAEWTDEGYSEKLNSGPETLNKAETELERLVRVANAGLAAVNEIHAKPGLKAQVEWRYTVSASREWEPLENFGLDCALRIKPRPAFPEFYVGQPVGSGNAWLVKLDSRNANTVKIGCQSFDAATLRETLQILCRDEYSVAVYKDQDTIVATRAGLEMGNHKLSWADADRILAALEAHFKTTTEAA